MKWVIIGLFGLGLAAAVCAAVLVVSFQGDDDGAGDGAGREATVLVAKHDLDAMSVLDNESVMTRQVAKSAVPVGALTDPVQAVGRMLAAAVQTGQPIAADNFIADGSSARLAASLKPGYRAVNVSLSDPMGMENLLAPGSVVDVLASIEMGSTDGMRSEPVSITLLQGVRVLAVGGRSIVTPSTGETAASDTGMSSARPTVTLLVNAREAEKLKLAMQQGSVTLALRNPKDAAHADVPGTGLASLSPIFYMPTTNDTPDQVVQVVVPQSLKRQWETVIVRGGIAETRSFAQSEPGQDR